jgi:hypothetical protein
MVFLYRAQTKASSSLKKPFLKRHAKRPTHVTAVEASSKTKSITNFVDDKKSSSVILSETLFSNFVAAV